MKKDINKASTQTSTDPLNDIIKNGKKSLSPQDEKLRRREELKAKRREEKLKIHKENRLKKPETYAVKTEGNPTTVKRESVPLGRPSDYSKELCAKLLVHMADGFSFETFGAVIYQTRRTLYNWADEHQDFMHAKEIGTLLGQYYWEKIGKDHVVSRTESIPNMGSNSYSLNSSVYSLIMKNRFGYREKLPDEVSKTDVTINQAPLNEELANKIIDAVAKISM